MLSIIVSIILAPKKLSNSSTAFRLSVERKEDISRWICQLADKS